MEIELEKAKDLDRNSLRMQFVMGDEIGHDTTAHVSRLQENSTSTPLTKIDKKLHRHRQKQKTKNIKKAKVSRKKINQKSLHSLKNNNKNKGCNFKKSVQMDQVQEIRAVNNFVKNLFTEKIEDFYKSQLAKTDFQYIKKLLNVRQYSLQLIVSNSTFFGEQIDSELETYLNYLSFLQRSNNQIAVLIKQQDKFYWTIFDLANQIEQSHPCLSPKTLIPISQSQIQIIKSRQSFMKKLALLNQKEANSNDLSKVNEIFKEILFLGKFIESLQKKNLVALRNLLLSMQQSQNITKPPQNYLDEYIKLLLRKNLQKALQYKPTYTLDYFKGKFQAEEGISLKPFQFQQQISRFIRVRRNSKNRTSKQHLYTSCSGCLSDYTEQINTLSYCKRCNTRIHKFCKLFYQHECNVCKFRSLKAKNNLLKECAMCTAEGLANVALDEGMYVHVFCLMSFNLFSVVQEKAIISRKINHFLETDSKINCCFQCHQNQGICVKFVDSQQYIHPSCAYFYGYKIESKPTTCIFKEAFQESERNLNLFSRKYRLNYEQIAYRFFSYEQYAGKSLQTVSLGEQIEVSQPLISQ